jgi:hypothetical protein
VKVKVEQDGGWPAEFQQLRQKPFDEADYARLHEIFFAKRPVVAGSRESRTRHGTLRVTERVVREKAMIEDWPRLNSQVESMHAAGQHEEALRHLRCLEFFLSHVGHPFLPRALRADGSADGFAAGEVVELLSDDDDDADKPEIIDVEALQTLILGPEGSTMPPPVKKIKVERETSADAAAAGPESAAGAAPVANHEDISSDEDDQEPELYEDTAWLPNPWTVGYEMDALDREGDWYAAKVREVRGSKAKVHFEGYDPRYDEWIETTSGKLAPLGTMAADDTDEEGEEGEEYPIVRYSILYTGKSTMWEEGE